MLFLQPMPMDEVAAANRPVAAEIYTMKVCAHAAPAWNECARASSRYAGQPVAEPGAGYAAPATGKPGR